MVGKKCFILFVCLYLTSISSDAANNDYSCGEGTVSGIRTAAREFWSPGKRTDWYVRIKLVNENKSKELKAAFELKFDTDAGKAAYASILAAKNNRRVVRFFSSQKQCDRFDSFAWGTHYGTLTLGLKQ